MAGQMVQYCSMTLLHMQMPAVDVMLEELSFNTLTTG